MRIRSFAALALSITLMAVCLPALAEVYTLPGILASVDVPVKTYSPILTPDTLKDNEAFIKSKGGTVEAWAADFLARGILLQTYDQDDSRVLVISALQDVDAQRMFDINEQTSETRAKYRLSHGADGAYSILGYRYDSVSWKNFPDVGRFLQLRYSYRVGGDLLRRGFQRRAIRNGFTITVDMQVFGRSLKASDNTALNKVFNTLRFTQILPMPELPVFLDESETAPVETSQSAFTMKGKTKPGAKLTAVLMSFATSQTQVFEAVAKDSGSYTLPVTLPGEDVYLMTLNIQYPGLEEFSKAYNIRYQKGLLPIQVTSAPPAEFTEDAFTLTGVTPESGVTARLTVNGKTTTKRPGINGTFSFTIDTSAPGAYNISLTLTKSGFNERSFQYAAARALSPQERETMLRDSAVSPPYQDLLDNPDLYDGQTLMYEGYIVSREEADSLFIFQFALQKTESGFLDLVVISSDTDPGYPINTPVRMYGQMIGMNMGQDDTGQDERLPKVELIMMEGV